MRRKQTIREKKDENEIKKENKCIFIIFFHNKHDIMKKLIFLNVSQYLKKLIPSVRIGNI